MGQVKCDHIKRLITFTSDNNKRLSMYLKLIESGGYLKTGQKFKNECGIVVFVLLSS
jgi:hypothetical protein